MQIFFSVLQTVAKYYGLRYISFEISVVLKLCKSNGLQRIAGSQLSLAVFAKKIEPSEQVHKNGVGISPGRHVQNDQLEGILLLSLWFLFSFLGSDFSGRSRNRWCCRQIEIMLIRRNWDGRFDGLYRVWANLK